MNFFARTFICSESASAWSLLFFPFTMQAQATRTNVQSITAAQSLAAVQTMLRAGLGCITYLRDLLPEENFTQSHLVADKKSLSYQHSDSSFSSTSSKQSRSTNGFKITTMTRGYSDEGDKILNYLENGIFDALQREYLRSFIFAIYLDNKEPNNIVEAYTFNFQYHTLPGTDITVPIMSLGDGLQKMSLKDKTRRGGNPVTEAAMRGKAPTLLDVKKSVKTLLKTLIQATTQMDVLPKRRFATFKLFYTDKTPADYEPPHFLPGDEKKDKWYFMTHDFDEVPDKWSIGKVDTGHHSVNLSVTSIATYLPSSTQSNNAAFGGTVPRVPMAPSLTPVEEGRLRAEQAERQIEDAQERNVVWSVEEAVDLHDLDAVGEDDPDYEHLPDGSYRKIASDEKGNLVPAGVRNAETGAIEPLVGPMDIEERHFGGVSETVPTRLNELNLNAAIERSNIEQTQDIGELNQEATSPPPTPAPHSPSSSSTANNIFDSAHRKSSWALTAMSPITSAISRRGSDADMEMLKDLHVQAPAEEMVTLDMETQMESIESYGPESGQTVDPIQVTPKSTHTKKPEDMIDNGFECECGITMEDESCFCEGGCGRWYHIWCMGYHSVKDPRMPLQFHCFSCRLKADPFWPLIKVDLYSVMLSRFQDLALFRRAVKTAEKHKLETLGEFAKAYGGRHDLARQMFKRLESEGFIVEQSTALDDLGFLQTRARSLKGGRKTKGKQPKNRKNVQKAKYRFNRDVVRTSQYADYFNPDPNVESRILKITELTSHLKSQHNAPNSAISKKAATLHHTQVFLEEAQGETQTQAETQLVLDSSGLKRSHPTEDDGTDTAKPMKKVKISVTYGLDLAE
ncbi:putative HORMA domain containing protein [Lyophyllum shimeji]|uniref:HORMA domain containing protein n=1 Tax=Lyophyllum shimeji TaxID=47721 RepID=A0A9P3UIV5_LYOSH|nr:putative HORMA domain containing protein [Lyophyllum shimeji]